MVSQLGTFLATGLQQTPKRASQPLLDLQLQCVQMLSFMEEEMGLYADYLAAPGGVDSIVDLLHFHLIKPVPLSANDMRGTVLPLLLALKKMAMKSTAAKEVMKASIFPPGADIEWKERLAEQRRQDTLLEEPEEISKREKASMA